MINCIRISSLNLIKKYTSQLEFKLRVTKLAKHDGHVHALLHCRHCSVIGTVIRKPRLSGFVNLLYAAFELLVTFHVSHSYITNIKHKSTTV